MNDLIAALRAAAHDPEPVAVDPVARLQALLVGTTSPKVTRNSDSALKLRLGQTARSEGFDSEAEYLKAQRRGWTSWMTTKSIGRNSYKRWAALPHVELRDPSPKVIAQRMAQAHANVFCPNLILGS